MSNDRHDEARAAAVAAARNFYTGNREGDDQEAWEIARAAYLAAWPDAPNGRYEIDHAATVAMLDAGDQVFGPRA